ncbi:hypothetical protein BpHYR1_047174 [Brachionus plicatilis]|uniref:Uncharacterized protein n=1 Tax=Brachionus plicatilis TaxID=10195 RepID=A0A3M7S2A6_BRAPC|nr:hypothetical protein BpHYR1_047174 [Brachionus plicatilis]
MWKINKKYCINIIYLLKIACDSAIKFNLNVKAMTENTLWQLNPSLRNSVCFKELPNSNKFEWRCIETQLKCKSKCLPKDNVIGEVHKIHLVHQITIMVQN